MEIVKLLQRQSLHLLLLLLIKPDNDLMVERSDKVSRYATAIGMLYHLLSKNVEHKCATQGTMPHVQKDWQKIIA
jgi:hypothetical protein